MAPPKAKLVRVRCLGPNPKEHSFWSRDAVRERVCKPCRERLDRLPVARLERPVNVRLD